MKELLKKLLVPVAMPLLSKIHRYRDIHKGESCYLFGDGVSIKWFNLKKFNNLMSIPAGLLPFHNDFSELSVKYLLLAEPFQFYPWERDPPISGKLKKNPRAQEYKKFIENNPEKEFILNLSNFPMLKYKNITYLFKDKFYDKNLPNNFITNKINAFHGSLRLSITLAIYMGFEKVYLVGYDYVNEPTRALHWYEKGIGKLTEMPNYQTDFFEIANQHIDITSITLDGNSKLTKSITYKEFCGDDPLYKENYDIVSSDYLKIISSWSGYTIY